MNSIFDYKSASNLVALSGLLLLASTMFSGIGTSATTLLVGGVIYLLLAWGLRGRMRWIAYLTFLILIIGISIAISGTFAPQGFASLLFIAIALMNLLAMIMLFAILWRGKPTTA